MKKREFGIISGILAVALSAPWLTHRHTAGQLQIAEGLLNQHASAMSQRLTENERLSHLASKTNSTGRLSQPKLEELLRLRSKAAELQETTLEMDRLRTSIGRLQDRLQDASAEEENGRENDTALLADELALRKTRVERLKRWLETNPAENIPELEFVPEPGEWASKVDAPLIADGDYREAIGLLRGDAETRFMFMAFSALKQYAKANNGQFPGDVSQLQPYFPSPIDDAVLQRYEVVPSSSLIPELAQAGGDWLITQKAPVNKAFDQRTAIGLANWRRSGGGKQWDPLP